MVQIEKYEVYEKDNGYRLVLINGYHILEDIIVDSKKEAHELGQHALEFGVFL